MDMGGVKDSISRRGAHQTLHWVRRRDRVLTLGLRLLIPLRPTGVAHGRWSRRRIPSSRVPAKVSSRNSWIGVNRDGGSCSSFSGCSSAQYFTSVRGHREVPTDGHLGSPLMAKKCPHSSHVR